MGVDVIVRVDDIDGPTLIMFSDWIQEQYPEIPVSAFLLNTDEWLRPHWERAASLIQKFGWEIGGHTRDHPTLSLLDSRQEIRDAIRPNIRDIEDGLAMAGLDYTVESFAYPRGDYDDRVVDVLKELAIKNGLTYPDGFPYSSVSRCPQGEERYAWGVTHHGAFEVDVWNDRFDRVLADDGLYVLCLHPPSYPNPSVSSLVSGISRRPDRYSERRSSVVALKLLWRWYNSDGWYSIVDQHLSYIRDHDGVVFTTFRGLPN